MLNELETMIDRYGLFAVLDHLSSACGLKAEHIQTNWQDEALAKKWEKAEAAMDEAAAKVLAMNLHQL